MLRFDDFILLLVILSSVLTGLLAPEVGRPFQPYIQSFLMSLLFISFLSIRVGTIRDMLRHDWRRLSYLALIKLILLPLLIYYLVRQVYPAYAVAALLLSGISTGVVAPFISNLLGANTSLVLASVVISSLLAPFSLSALLELLVGQTTAIPLIGMMVMLAQLIFIPLFLGEALHRLTPRLVAGLIKWRFPFSLIFFAVINLGVFSKYASYFHQKPGIILSAVAVATVLAAVFLLAGLLSFRRGPLIDQLAAAISLSNVNNVLVIVFASEFFGPREPTLAAFYMVPFFGLIVPLRIYRRWRSGD